MKRRLGSDEIRDTFLRFFSERQHARIEAASLVPANDPTLLFAAGLDAIVVLLLPATDLPGTEARGWEALGVGPEPP